MCSASSEFLTNSIIPSFPDHKDPEIAPSKLFRVERVKPIKNNPYWERRILRDLGLFTVSISHQLRTLFALKKTFFFQRGQIAIVKNIPENNARLWKVKHLVKISPITFPHGEPTAADVNHTFLKENGDCLVTKRIEIADSKVEATEQFKKDSNRLDGETLRRDSRLKWLSGW
jgi:large subunit ribosomal protein L30